ncbi:hypothetical protein IAU60_003636 [Kwoniella sp. DSM 27419]
MSLPDVNAVMWSMMGSVMIKTTWFAAMGSILQSIVVTWIVSHTFRYFEYFTRTDSVWLLGGVASGALLSVGALALSCAQVYRLVHIDNTNIAKGFRFLVLSDMSHLLIGAVFNVAAGSYYAYRAYRITRGRWWIIPPFAIGLVAQFIVALIATYKGMVVPVVTLEVLPQLQGFMLSGIKWFKAWGALTLAVDGSLCFFMTFMLFKSKSGLFHNQPRLFNKLLSITYETMLPPVICLLILEAASQKEESPMTDFRRVISTVLPVLYYHSTLSTLVGRQKVRAILHESRVASGLEVYQPQVDKLAAGSGRGTQSGGIFYYSRGKADRDLRSDLELQKPSGPFVRIDTVECATTPTKELSPVDLPLHTLGLKADADVRPDQSITRPIWDLQVLNKWESTGH